MSQASWAAHLGLRPLVEVAPRVGAIAKCPGVAAAEAPSHQLLDVRLFREAQVVQLAQLQLCSVAAAQRASLRRVSRLRELAPSAPLMEAWAAAPAILAVSTLQTAWQAGLLAVCSCLDWLCELSPLSLSLSLSLSASHLQHTQPLCSHAPEAHQATGEGGQNARAFCRVRAAN